MNVCCFNIRVNYTLWKLCPPPPPINSTSNLIFVNKTVYDAFKTKYSIY